MFKLNDIVIYIGHKWMDAGFRQYIGRKYRIIGINYSMNDVRLYDYTSGVNIRTYISAIKTTDSQLLLFDL